MVLEQEWQQKADEKFSQEEEQKVEKNYQFLTRKNHTKGSSRILSKTNFFKKKEHIKKATTFKEIFREGKKISFSGAKLFYKKNDLAQNRVGFSLSRGYGNAVQRNKSKRYSREVYRIFRKNLKKGYDIIFLVYPGNDTFQKRFFQFQMLCEKAGLLEK